VVVDDNDWAELTLMEKKGVRIGRLLLEWEWERDGWGCQVGRAVMGVYANAE
jgi:hypothetical protein